MGGYSCAKRFRGYFITIAFSNGLRDIDYCSCGSTTGSYLYKFRFTRHNGTYFTEYAKMGEPISKAKIGDVLYVARAALMRYKAKHGGSLQ